MNEIEYLADRLLKEAGLLRVSDIHIVPRKNDAVVRFRLDGLLMEKGTLTKETCERLITHFKFLAGMDIGERRRPQSGAMETNQQGEIIYLRLSTLPTLYDESLVIRLLPQSFFLPQSQLSLFSRSTNTLLFLFQQPQGLVIFTGPTGSGKTTTLYTLLRICQEKRHRNVITLEDPVEKRIDNLLQVQINEKAGITYAAGLKAALRHDPDVIMVGEIRDAETAKIAVRSAMTGHLIVSTMHTNNAVGAIYRLREFGIPLEDIEQTLLAVTAQRLVDLLCPFCGEQCLPVCRQYRKMRRVAVHELLYGNALSDAIQSVQTGSKLCRYYTLENIIRKGVALGFLPAHALAVVKGGEK
jgi:competence protein ComGA